MMIHTPLPGETSLLFSPIGFHLLDEMTGSTLFGPVKALLDRQDQMGEWHETDVEPVITPGGNITYPHLERWQDPNGAPPRYRCRIEADFYVPLYRATVDGIEFDAFPYNDTNPPANLPPPPPPPSVFDPPQDVVLTPATNYPFPGHVPVLRGRVVDAVTSVPAADALVTQPNQERVVSDSRGAFALPLRWVPPNVPSQIVVSHPRTLRNGLLLITIPQDLGQNIEIPIN